MATLTVSQITLSGVAPSFVAADVAGDLFANASGTTMFHVKNGDSSAHELTFDCQKPCSYGFDHDVVISVPAGEERIVGPFSAYRFNNTSGLVAVAYDGVTNVTVAAYNLVMS